MNSHGIPIFTMRTGQGAQRTPQEKSQVRFHTGTRLHRIKDPARGRADIPPGGARSWTPRESGTRAADWAVAAAQSAVSFQRGMTLGNEKERPADSGSELQRRKFTRRLMARVGCRSRPRFRVCWKRVIRDWKENPNPNLVIVYGPPPQLPGMPIPWTPWTRSMTGIAARCRGSARCASGACCSGCSSGKSYPPMSMKDRPARAAAKLRQQIGLEGEAFGRRGRHVPDLEAETYEEEELAPDRTNGSMSCPMISIR